MGILNDIRTSDFTTNLRGFFGLDPLPDNFRIFGNQSNTSNQSFPEKDPNAFFGEGNRGFGFDPNNPSNTLTGTDREQFDALNRALQRGQEKNSAAKKSAINLLLGEGGLTSQFGDFFDPLISQTENVLKVDPFSNQLADQILQKGNSLITGQGIENERRRSTALAGRGLSSGGSTGRGIGSDLFGEQVGARTSLDKQVAESQVAFNNAANRARQQLLGQLTQAKSAGIGQATNLAAGIQAGDVNDPTSEARLLESFLVRNANQDERDRIFEFINSAADGQQRNSLIRFVIDNITTFRGGPALQSLGTGLGELIAPVSGGF